MELGLEDKVAVITGGSAGIGAAVADGLAAEGVHIAICARGGVRAAEVAASIATRHGVRAIGVEADVGTAGDIDAFVDEVLDTLGGVDILINNAGTGSEEKIMTAPDERWQFYLDLHLMAAVRMSRLVVPSMRSRGGGVIINNSSICSKQPLGYEPIYNVSKAALSMFSKCLANELIADNIRVNTVNPGLVLTDDWVATAKALTRDDARTWEDYLEGIATENAPIGRFATPAELAHFFVFLCSPLAGYCVGSSYFVDGGWLNTVT